MLARITVQLRKPLGNDGEHIFRYEEIALNTDNHTVTVCGKSVKATRTEYAILKLLMENPAQVITKSVMLDRISEDTPDCVEGSLKVHISNLRKKLKTISDRECIESVWGIGFRLLVE